MAKLANVSQPFISQLQRGVRNASAPVADKLAELTGTDIRIWLKGGSVQSRLQAMSAWGERRGVKAAIKRARLLIPNSEEAST